MTATAEDGEPTAGLRGVGIALIGFAVAVAAAWGTQTALKAAGNPGGDVALFCASEVALWICLVASVIFVSRRRGTGDLRRDFGWRIRRADLGIGALGAVGVGPQRWS